MARPATGARPLLATIAGLVAGALATAALAVSGLPHRTRATSTVAAPAHPAQDFLVQWRRMRLGTWAVDARFERVTQAGRRLQIRLHMAQRPPDRLITGLGSIDARRGGERLACAPDADGGVHCRDGGPAPAYDADVAQELDYLRRYVLGAGALYRVAESRGCYTLRLRFRLPSPPYGEQARFCFDRPTGAPIRSEIVRKEARDQTVAVSVRARPTDADLDPERWGGGGRG
ncbi:MAG: hypothetical protein QOE35_44 [Actinomycetota bacterium]|jgi:hypothetical protein